MADCGALADRVGAGVDIHPEALAGCIYMYLRDAPIAERGGAAERVREDELVSRRDRRAAMQRRGEFGPSYRRDYRHHGHHDERLDHRDAAPLGLEHIRAAPRSGFSAEARRDRRWSYAPGEIEAPAVSPDADARELTAVPT